MIYEETPLRDEIKKHIRILIKPLKEDEELIKVLKVKLTKKSLRY